MATLDYRRAPVEDDDERPSKLRDVLLAFLPVATTLLTLVYVFHWLREPFGIFRPREALVLVGIPAIVIAMWAVWLVAAFRRPRAIGWVVSALLGWCALLVPAAVYSITGNLFRSPWNQ